MCEKRWRRRRKFFNYPHELHIALAIGNSVSIKCMAFGPLEDHMDGMAGWVADWPD